jgi:hypothetical protein
MEALNAGLCQAQFLQGRKLPQESTALRAGDCECSQLASLDLRAGRGHRFNAYVDVTTNQSDQRVGTALVRYGLKIHSSCVCKQLCCQVWLRTWTAGRIGQHFGFGLGKRQDIGEVLVALVD